MGKTKHEPNRSSEAHVPADGAPQDLGGGAEVDGPVGRLGVHPLAEEAEVLHLLADEAAGHADLLAADHHDLLAVEQLLGDDRGEAAEHVVARVHHDALGAHAGAGHHRALTCEAAAAARKGLEWLVEADGVEARLGSRVSRL